MSPEFHEPRFQTRPPDRRRFVADTLRKQIISGELSPGSRLPTRLILEPLFDVSTVTLQRGIDCLAREGFVYSDGRKGTFVSEHPAHLHHFALIEPGFSDYSRYWNVLAQVHSLAAEFLAPSRISIHRSIDGRPDNEDYNKLVKDVEHQRVAGLIFGNNPCSLQNSALLEQTRVPCVAVSAEQTIPGLPVVMHDGESFLAKALDHFVEHGRRKIAMIGGFINQPAFYRILERGLVSRGMEMPSYWRLHSNIHEPQGVRNMAHLLMRKSRSEPSPDGVLILDDTVLESALLGMMDAGARPPDDVHVIAMTNFPWAPSKVLPVRRLGYDTIELLQTCIQILKAQTEGRKDNTSVRLLIEQG